MIDFSENSDDFSDQGATISEIWGDYYLNYIPEMIRLVIPVAVFTACLFLVGQLSERLEITALKAAGISLYRLSVPFIAFAIFTALIVSYLDANTIPISNKERIEFEQKFIKRKSETIDRNNIYRELSENSVIKINYFDKDKHIGYRIRIVEYNEDGIQRTLIANQMHWVEESQKWKLESVTERVFYKTGYTEAKYDDKDTTLSVFPRDLSRTTSDIYQLTYKEAQEYIQSIERSGAGSVNVPKVQYLGRVVYPISIIIVMIVGFAVASVRRRGGKGIYIAAGLTISFLYLAFMKIAEPFGYYGNISPLTAVSIPHIFFLIVGVILLLKAKK
tara:strand:+ start:446 stop:1441 length:996 start_codon:yes stop_codon:yes gene_type:complete